MRMVWKNRFFGIQFEENKGEKHPNCVGLCLENRGEAPLLQNSTLFGLAVGGAPGGDCSNIVQTWQDRVAHPCALSRSTVRPEHKKKAGWEPA